MTLGDILRNLLAERSITQKQLADDLKIGASTLGNYIQSNREPDYETLKRLADYFGVTTDYLLDHRSNQAVCHIEDEFLRIFRALTQDQKELSIEYGKVLIAWNSRTGKSSDSKTASVKKKI